MMLPDQRPVIFIVDDDDAMRDSLVWLLEPRGMRVVAYASAEAFLADYQPEPILNSCIVLDVRMPGISGLELYEEIARRPNPPPAIFITGHGDIPMAVSALKKGAADFIEKPFNDREIVALIDQCLEKDRVYQVQRQQSAGVVQRLAQLTAREREVMELVMAGRLNKQIADELGISIKTVEVHRARVMEKMAAGSVAELVRVVMAAKKA